MGPSATISSELDRTSPRSAGNRSGGSPEYPREAYPAARPCSSTRTRVRRPSSETAPGRPVIGRADTGHPGVARERLEGALDLGAKGRIEGGHGGAAEDQVERGWPRGKLLADPRERAARLRLGGHVGRIEAAAPEDHGDGSGQREHRENQHVPASSMHEPSPARKHGPVLPALATHARAQYRMLTRGAASHPLGPALYALSDRLGGLT